MLIFQFHFEALTPGNAYIGLRNCTEPHRGWDIGSGLQNIIAGLLVEVSNNVQVMIQFKLYPHIRFLSYLPGYQVISIPVDRYPRTVITVKTKPISRSRKIYLRQIKEAIVQRPDLIITHFTVSGPQFQFGDNIFIFYT